MPRVRIKKLPSNKRKVRIKRLPGFAGLPNSVPYAGLQKFIFTNGGVPGGIDSSIGKNPITFGLQNSENLLGNPFAQNVQTMFDNPLTGQSAGLVMNQDGNLEETSKKDPNAGTGEGTQTEGDKFYTETFKQGWGLNDGPSLSNQAIADMYEVAGLAGTLKQKRRQGNQIATGDEVGRQSSREDRGDYGANDGLFRVDKMGAKQLVQRGGIPLYNPGGPAPQPTFDKDGNEWVTVTGYYTGAENPDAADVSGDASTYYGQIKKTPYTKRILRSDYDRLMGAKGKYHTQQDILRGTKYGRSNKSFDERGYNVAATNPNYKYALGVDKVKELNPEYYPSQGEMFSLNEEILGMKPIDLRGVKGADDYTVEENPFGFRQQQLDVEYDVAYGDCPPCPDGSIPERDADNNCLECPQTEVKKDTTPAATSCPCPNDPKEGPFTGTIVPKAGGGQECECSGFKNEATQQQQERDPEFWLQDTIKTTGIAGDLATLKKYTPQLQQVDLEEGDAAFVDPTRALAANAEQANIAAQAASSFAGPQGTARLSAIQGKGAAQAANILDKTNQQNVGIANQLAQANQNIRNQEALQNAKFRQQYYDQSTIANQQFDNSKRAMRSALRDQYGNAITNMMTTDAMNKMYPNYAVDAGAGGKTLFTGSDGRKTSPTYQQNYDTFYNAAIKRGMTAPEADKSARARADKQLLSESGAAGSPRYAGYPGSSSGKYGAMVNQMLGGNVYEHGGAHKEPFGSSNRGSIQPSSYTSGVNQNSIPFGSQTTSTIGAVPRQDANLEAEGGETVFGDINGDGFPETNKITGPRHSDGGVPLNLPNDSFIFSDYKKGNMKISDPEVLKMFGKSGSRRKGSRKKPAYTPAELAKQYDVNKYRALLQDPDADNISKRTAEIMIENYNMKLGALALVQESSKGFPQGVPKVARPYMEENGISEEELMPQQPQNTVQRPNEQFFSEAEVMEEQT